MDDGRQRRADELRRRLYRAGATEADVRRYLEAAPAPTPDPVVADAPAAPARRRALRPVGIAVLGAAAVAVVALLASPGAGRPAPGALPARSAPPDGGGGRLLAVGQGRTTAPAAVVTAVGTTPVLGRRVEGRGSAAVDLDPAAGQVDGGRAVVAVATDGSTRVTWRALLDVTHPDRTTSVLELAHGRAAAPSAPVTATTFAFRARPPTRIAVMAPEGARWALVYAATDGREGAAG